MRHTTMKYRFVKIPSSIQYYWLSVWLRASCIIDHTSSRVNLTYDARTGSESVGRWKHRPDSGPVLAYFSEFIRTRPNGSISPTSIIQPISTGVIDSVIRPAANSFVTSLQHAALSSIKKFVKQFDDKYIAAEWKCTSVYFTISNI